MKAIEADAVEKVFRDKDDFKLGPLSFSVDEGELLCVLGRNGSGKTTLLKCIAGLATVDSGQLVLRIRRERDVVLSSFAVSIPRPVRRRLGFVFQGSAVWPHRSVLENVAGPLRETRGMNRSEAEEVATHWLGEDRLAVPQRLWHRLPVGLSGGETRRLAIARTLATKPELLLLDEFEAHLDPEMVERVFGIIEKEYVQSPERTVVMVTHRVDFIGRASHVLVLDKGQLIHNSEPSDLIKSPRAEVVAFMSEVMDPSRSGWAFSRECLRTSRRIAALVLKESAEGSGFQEIAQEVFELIKGLDTGSQFLVLIVTKEKNSEELWIRGACKTDEFLLNGKHADQLGQLVVRRPADEYNTEGSEPRFIFGNEYVKTLGSETGVRLGGYGSLIRMMLERGEEIWYRPAENWPAIPGVWGTETPPVGENGLLYYEFSQATRHVYLFRLEWKGDVVGVVSVDTDSDEGWRRHVFEGLLSVANVGAIALRRIDSL